MYTKKFFWPKKNLYKEKVIKLKNFTKIMPPIDFKVNVVVDRRKENVGKGMYNNINIHIYTWIYTYIINYNGE